MKWNNWDTPSNNLWTHDLSGLGILAKSGDYRTKSGAVPDILADVLAPAIQDSILGTFWNTQEGTKETSGSFTGADIGSFGEDCRHLSFSSSSTFVQASSSCSADEYSSDHAKMGISKGGTTVVVGGLNRAPNHAKSTDGHCSQCCRGTLYWHVKSESLNSALAGLLQSGCPGIL